MTPGIVIGILVCACALAGATMISRTGQGERAWLGALFGVLFGPVTLIVFVIWCAVVAFEKMTAPRRP